MSGKICVDASLALKLVLPEVDSQLAAALWEEWQKSKTVVVSTDLWRYEVTSVIRNKGHRGILTWDEETEAIHQLYQMPVLFLRPQGIHQRAWELARHFNRSAAYDAHYLAMAEIEGCPFWTADERLYNAVATEFDWIHWLGNS